jgi:hypothetical protein
MRRNLIFAYNNPIALGVDDIERIHRAIVGAKGKRLTYLVSRGAKPRGLVENSRRRARSGFSSDPRQLWLPFIGGDEQ